METKTNSKAIAALILGLLGLIFTLERGVLMDLLGIVICIVGLVLSILTKKELAKGESGRGLATAGMILSIIGMVIAGFGVLCSACALAAMGAVTLTQFIF